MTQYCIFYSNYTYLLPRGFDVHVFGRKIETINSFVSRDVLPLFWGQDNVIAAS